MAKTPLFRGSCTAIITPFTNTGVDYEQLERNIEFQYENGTAAVVACGTTHTVSVPVRLPGAAARALSLLERLRGNSGLTAEAWLFEPD